MDDVRARIKESARKAVGETVPAAVLPDLTEAELDAAVEDLPTDRLELAAEHGSELYATSEVLRAVMRNRGVMIEHDRTWPDPRDVEERFGDLPEETRDTVEASFGDVWEQGPAGYGELVEAYRTLTDGLLDDLSYLTQGDPVAGEDVRVVVEHGGQQFEATMETVDGTVDVDGLVDLLNEVVAATAETDRRYCWSNVHDSQTVGVWFVTEVHCEMLDSYYATALASELR